MKNSMSILDSLLDKGQKKKLSAELAMLREIAEDRKASREDSTRILRIRNERSTEQMFQIADQYEILCLGKKEIRKIPVAHKQALIYRYKKYIHDFEEGKLNRKGLVSFDEAEDYNKIKAVVEALELSMQGV